MKGTQSDQIFRGLQPPELPDDLPPLVLSRARAALREPAYRRDVWARILHNRGLRLAWAASVAALCFANLMLGGLITPEPQAGPRPSIAANRMIEPEIRQIVDLPPLKIAGNGVSASRGPYPILRPGMENPS